MTLRLDLQSDTDKSDITFPETITIDLNLTFYVDPEPEPCQHIGFARLFREEQLKAR